MADRFRALELFVSLRSTGSFSATGRAFRLSSTSVSREISMLEERLGQSLLTRSTRNVRLTEAGEEFARRAEEILASLNSLEESLSELRNRPAGILRIHARSMFGIGILTPLLPEFSQLYPEISIEVSISEEPADLRREKIDVEFRLAEPQEPGLKRRRIYSAERWLVASPDYLAARGTPQSIADLSQHDCMAYYSGTTGAHWWLTKPDGAKERIPFVPRFASNNGAVLLELARRGCGAVVLDDYIVRKDIESGALVRLIPEAQISSTVSPGGLYVAILDNQVTPAKVRVFVDYLCAKLEGSARRFQVTNAWERTQG